MFAVGGGWTLPEFCWSVWLAGLVLAWSRTVSVAAEIVLTARSRRAEYDRHMASIRSMPAAAYAAALVLLVGSLALIVLYAYGLVFALYGLLLSFFAEMEPLELFGNTETQRVLRESEEGTGVAQFDSADALFENLDI